MKLRWWLSGILCAAVAVLFAGEGIAQDKKGHEGHGHDHGSHEGHDHAQGEGQMDEEAMMEAWQAANAVGEHHHAFRPMVGTWKVESKWYMAPDAEPGISTGKSVKTLIFDGRFLKEELFMEESAFGAFQGLGYAGYNSTTGQYEHTWMDSMSNMIMTSTGTADASGKTFTYKSEYMDPMMKQMRKARVIIKVINNNKHLFEMYESVAGHPEYKAMEITYTKM